MPFKSDKALEMWLPTNVTKVTVIDGKVNVWDEMTMEKRILQKPAGFTQKEGESDALVNK